MFIPVYGTRYYSPEGAQSFYLKLGKTVFYWEIGLGFERKVLLLRLYKIGEHNLTCWYSHRMLFIKPETEFL